MILLKYTHRLLTQEQTMIDINIINDKPVDLIPCLLSGKYLGSSWSLEALVTSVCYVSSTVSSEQALCRLVPGQHENKHFEGGKKSWQLSIANSRGLTRRDRRKGVKDLSNSGRKTANFIRKFHDVCLFLFDISEHCSDHALLSVSLKRQPPCQCGHNIWFSHVTPRVVFGDITISLDD